LVVVIDSNGVMKSRSKWRRQGRRRRRRPWELILQEGMIYAEVGGGRRGGHHGATLRLAVLLKVSRKEILMCYFQEGKKLRKCQSSSMSFLKNTHTHPRMGNYNTTVEFENGGAHE
jgi:hypothetical protein